jgi:putative spermidine/putrescine transport system permease protein
MRRTGRPALAFHCLFLAFMLAPLLVVVLVAFTATGYVALPVHGFSLRWFHAIFDNSEFIDAFWTSVHLALISATLALLVILPASFAIAHHRFPGRDLLAGVLMAPLMVPTVVLGVSFLRLLSATSMTGTFTGLVLCHIVIVTPFVLRMALASLVGLDRDIQNAAISLGAGRWALFRRVTLPLIMPGVVGGWVLAFIHSFDELTVTIFVASPSTMTLPVRLFSRIAETIDPLVTSVSTVIIAISVVLLVLLDRVYGVDRLMLGGGSR